MSTYTPGDVVRVLTHNPHSSRLLAGDEVTVAIVKRDEREREVIIVDTDSGRRALHATDVEMVTAAYRPATPEAAVSEAFYDILVEEFTLDSNFGALFDAADAALGAVDDEVSAALTPPDPGADAAHHPHDSARHGEWKVDEDDDDSIIFIVDWANDKMGLSYGERLCATHGIREAAFFCKTEGGSTVVIPAHRINEIVVWLQERASFSKRPQDPPASAQSAA